MLLAILIFILCKYVFNFGQSKETALSNAIRRTSYDLDYIDKEANIIALGANVITRGHKVIIEIPTRGLWQFATNSQVAQCLMDRVNSKEFKRFLDLNYKGVVFSKPTFEQNKIVIIGSKSNFSHRFGSLDPRSEWHR
ncbi:hypothetical protein [Lactobacillus agrestimuris]|uniref:hypothetical protein n=1 Tax=Lactobacillus agrestimuris TaxID=2941328 RepID=UPI002043F444|nr:hypothetical protein [Lactobacillus agrestimuris]